MFGYGQTDCERDCYADMYAFFGGDALSCDIPQRFYRVCDDRPKATECCVKSGSYCGKHIVVDADRFECLSRLTLAILEIATLSSDDFDARFSTKKTVDITETFVASYDGKLVLVKGSRAISAEDYNKLLEAKTLDIPGAVRKFTESSSKSNTSLQDSIIESLDSAVGKGISPSEIETVPRRLPSVFRSQSNDRASAIESLLQLNQVIVPTTP